MELPCDDKILIKYENHMSKEDYEKYTWIVYFIQTITETTCMGVNIDYPNITQNNFNDLPMDKQVSLIIKSIKQVFIFIINRIILINNISLSILHDKFIPIDDVFIITIKLLYMCLKRSVITENIDMVNYIKTIIHDEFEENSYNVDHLEASVSFTQMIFALYLTKGIISHNSTPDNIKNNVDNIMTSLVEIMKRKNREATRKYSN